MKQSSSLLEHYTESFGVSYLMLECNLLREKPPVTHITECNQHLLQLLGYAKDDLINKEVLMILGKGSYNKSLSRLFLAMKQELPFEGMITLYGVAQQPIWVNAQCFLFNKSDNNKRGATKANWCWLFTEANADSEMKRRFEENDTTLFKGFAEESSYIG